MGVDEVTAPDGVDVPRWVCDDPQKRTVMSGISTVRLDLAETVFPAHGADVPGWAVLRKTLRQDQVVAFVRPASYLGNPVPPPHTDPSPA